MILVWCSLGNVYQHIFNKPRKPLNSMKTLINYKANIWPRCLFIPLFRFKLQFPVRSFCGAKSSLISINVLSLFEYTQVRLLSAAFTLPFFSVYERESRVLNVFLCQQLHLSYYYCLIYSRYLRSCVHAPPYNNFQYY